MITAERDTECLECETEHAMLMMPDVEEDEIFEGDCPECGEMTEHELSTMGGEL